MSNEATPRIDGLDTLRGLTLVSMTAYHACWDLVYMFGVDWPWYRSAWAFLWQQSICRTFILLSGYCFRLGRNPVRRGATVFACGTVITLFTVVFMPDNRIFFGVLSLLGAASLLTAALDRCLSAVPAPVGLAASFALFVLCRRVPQGLFAFAVRLPAWLYRNDFAACFGFPPPHFFSTDYFPLLPWLFLFWCGYFLHRLAPRPPRRFATFRLPVVTAAGRLSLWVYMAHQPVTYALLSLLFQTEVRP